jgi:predicted nucleic acid-binding protein
MAKSVIVDAGFLAALLRQRDVHRDWAAAGAGELPPPWHTCEAALSEAFHLLGRPGAAGLVALVLRRSVLISFALDRELEPVLKLMQKYVDVPMSLADACLVRMTETFADPIVLTTDADFHIYRRHSRQVIPISAPR